MSKDEIKDEIIKVLDRLPDKSLQDLLNFLKGLEEKHPTSIFNSDTLNKILSEDRELLQKLAQ